MNREDIISKFKNDLNKLNEKYQCIHTSFSY